MQKNILWTGIKYHSVENCIVTITDKGSIIKSAIIGMYDKMIYKVEYEIQTNQKWETVSFKINAQLNNRMEIIQYKSDGKGNWFLKGQAVKKFTGCAEIDISLTPFTNTLPINRMKLSEKEAQSIKVLYVDVLAMKTKIVKQKYTRLSQTKYKYENIPNDFEAILSIDESGLVVKYPRLFKRTIIIKSNYRL